MNLTGNSLIGREGVSGSSDSIQAINPSTNERLEPVYTGGTAQGGPHRAVFNDNYT